MDMTKFKAQQAKALVSYVKSGTKTVTVFSKQSDLATGEEIESTVEQVQLQGVDDSIAAVRKQRTEAVNKFDEHEAGLIALRTVIVDELAK